MTERPRQSLCPLPWKTKQLTRWSGKHHPLLMQCTLTHFLEGTLLTSRWLFLTKMKLSISGQSRNLSKMLWSLPPPELPVRNWRSEKIIYHCSQTRPRHSCGRADTLHDLLQSDQGSCQDREDRTAATHLGSWHSRTGAGSWLLRGRKLKNSRRLHRASTSLSKALWATPENTENVGGSGAGGHLQMPYQDACRRLQLGCHQPSW